jgi:DNA repair photolyase
MLMKIQEVEAKSLVTKSKLPDADFVINPYGGCIHGCVYCYAEFMSRFNKHDGLAWGEYIDVKTCGRPLPLKQIAGKSVLIGSVTDPYNPLEKKYGATRRILEQLSAADCRVEILTKSPLVLRDVDLLRQFKDIRVGISLSTTDERLARLTECHAVPPSQRLEAMARLAEGGIRAYAFISPIFPYLSDWRNVAEQAAPYVEETCFENLNLRGGYRKRVLDLVREHYPAEADAFQALYQDKAALRGYWEAMADEIRSFMSGSRYKIFFFHNEIKK